MRFAARLTEDAEALARAHKETLERLPATLHASILVELQKWPTLFGPEQAYQRALLQHLSSLPKAELVHLVAGISRVETSANTSAISVGDPARFQDEAQALLRKRRLLTQWRDEVAGLFQKVDATLEARLYPPDAPRRLVIQLYGSGIGVQTEKLWSRFRDVGFRVPLTLDQKTGPEDFLAALFGGRDRIQDSAGAVPFDAWIIECGETLHAVCEAGAGSGSGAAMTGLSYDRLRRYRDELTRALYSKVQSGVSSPQEFAAYARSLTVVPGPGVLLYSSRAPSPELPVPSPQSPVPSVLQTFVRDVLLTGNGTLFVNNTFVEWAAVQALKRAQPRLLVARYGVRDKMKPFSSLLLFSQPRASDQIPLIEDPLGSFIDVEQLTYYVWLNAEKSPAYRRKTLYVFLAEDIDEMLAIRSDMPDGGTRRLSPARLSDVRATMAHWLGAPVPAGSGRIIDALVG